MVDDGGTGELGTSIGVICTSNELVSPAVDQPEEPPALLFTCATAKVMSARTDKGKNKQRTERRRRCTSKAAMSSKPMKAAMTTIKILRSLKFGPHCQAP